MRQLLILLMIFGFVFAQDEDAGKKEYFVEKTIKDLQVIIPFPGMFEISEEMIKKIDEARAIHRALIKKIRVMSAEEKISYFENMRKEAKTKMKTRLEELSPELKARIKVKMDEIKTKFEKKDTKIDEFKTTINSKRKSGIDKAEIKAKIDTFKARLKTKKDIEE